MEDESKRLQNELKTKQRAIETALNGIAFGDTEGILQDVNESFVRMWGYDSKEEIIGRSALEFWHDTASAAEVMKKALLGEQVLNELLGVKKDGTLFDVLVSASQVTDKDGNLIYIMSSFIDISEHKKAERRMKFLSTALNTAADVVFVIDRDTMRFIEVNDTAIKFLGYSREEFERMGPQDIKPDYSSQDLYDIFDRVLEGKCEQESLETLHKSKNGTVFPVEVRIRALIQNDTRMIIAVARDITERVEMEERLKEALTQSKELNRQLEEQTEHAQSMAAKAEEASKAKSRFLAVMSHEMRTPLNGVLGMTDLLNETSLSETQERYLSNIRSGGETLLERINDILDMTKLESGSVELKKSQFDLASFVENCINSLRMSAYNKGLDFRCAVDTDEKEIVEGDPERLEQIVKNLVKNAIKFTSEGRVTVSIKKIEEEQETITYEFSVEDTGCGISESKKESIFDYFSQGDDSFTREQGGMGLGLAISKRLTELMGGELDFESEEGKGTRFRVTLVLGKVR